MGSVQKSLLLFSSCVCLLGYHAPPADATININLLEFVVRGNETSNAGALNAVFDKGEEDLRTKYGSLFNITRSRFYDRNGATDCSHLEQTATLWATRMYCGNVHENSVMAVFGPSCPAATAMISYLAKEWNIPTFSGLGLGLSGGTGALDRTRYSTLTRVSDIMDADMNQFIYKVLTAFGYHTVVLLCDDDNDDDLYTTMCMSVVDALRHYGLTTDRSHQFTVNRFYIQADDRANIRHYLQDSSDVARVILIFAPASHVRSIMLAAFDKNMTGEEYVYFAVQPAGDITWYSEKDAGRNEDARTAFRSLFIMSPRVKETPEYQNFSKEVQRLSTEKYNYVFSPGEQVNPVAVSYYYALDMYSQVLNETITNGDNPNDGAALSQRMRNRTYTVLGRDITINVNGDTSSDWLLSQMNSTGNFTSVMEYSARQRILQPSRDPVDNSIRRIVWPNNRTAPSPDEPRCGYRGLKLECQTPIGKLLPMQ
ncbi:atrial natriuretic peptide receptor 1-like [Paramacrobiotus metropolitanus]|uniref:atrial natriuretic peptide receptor 1-like n=1 Tax=Paramacrobiotus metropolitanus TaxID=2943436 RepID=UPI002445F2C5|nr:atrial natriuretic peptide receptor 1-like [Paramacrobiotus metropolitanus]